MFIKCLIVQTKIQGLSDRLLIEKWGNTITNNKRHYQQKKSYLCIHGLDQNPLCLELHIKGSKYVYF